MSYQPSEKAVNSAEDLIDKARNGDNEAFGLIFEQHHLFIYKFIYAMVGQHTLAEELTQETFLGAYRNIQTMRNDSSVRTWLCAIAKNIVYTGFRQNQMESRRCETELEALNLVDKKNPLPDKQVLNKELNQNILSALDKLGESKRIVFILREMQGLSYQDISEITGSSISKLKTDLFRAKIEMKALLRFYIGAKK